MTSVVSLRTRRQGGPLPKGNAPPLGFRRISQKFFVKYVAWKLPLFRKLLQYKIRTVRRDTPWWRETEISKGSIKRIEKTIAYPNQFIGTHRRRILRDPDFIRSKGGF